VTRSSEHYFLSVVCPPTRTGKGICRFPGGQEYEGTYKNGLREGRGTVTFAEGAVYEGRFKVYPVLREYMAFE
jgi:hypothetical protein